MKYVKALSNNVPSTRQQTGLKCNLYSCFPEDSWRIEVIDLKEPVFSLVFSDNEYFLGFFMTVWFKFSDAYQSDMFVSFQRSILPPLNI